MVHLHENGRAESHKRSTAPCMHQPGWCTTTFVGWQIRHTCSCVLGMRSAKKDSVSAGVRTIIAPEESTGEPTSRAQRWAPVSMSEAEDEEVEIIE